MHLGQLACSCIRPLMLLMDHKRAHSHDGRNYKRLIQKITGEELGKAVLLGSSSITVWLFSGSGRNLDSLTIQALTPVTPYSRLSFSRQRWTSDNHGIQFSHYLEVSFNGLLDYVSLNANSDIDILCSNLGWILHSNSHFGHNLRTCWRYTYPMHCLRFHSGQRRRKFLAAVDAQHRWDS